MASDIRDRKDIVRLIDRFYDKVKDDAQIARFFTEVVVVQWDKHLSVMYDFWENALFYSGNYSGNPMLKHRALHEKSALCAADFERWLLLFTTTVDEMYAGKYADTIKQRAEQIATVMQIKIIQNTSAF